MEQEKVYIKTVDELDNFFHDVVMKQMSSEKDDNITVPDFVISRELWSRFGVDNLFHAVMMKAIERARNDKSLQGKDNADFENMVSRVMKEEGAICH